MKKEAIHMKFLNHSTRFCLLLTLLCHSYTSDYLDTAPTNQVSPADLFKDEAYAAYAVSGLEKLVKTTYPTDKLDGVSFNSEGSIKLMCAEYQGADMHCSRNNFYTIFNGTSHAIPTSGYTEYVWHYYCRVISNTNAIINYVDPGSSHEFKYIYAQAPTYRAYCYLQLLQSYSPHWCDSQNGSADGVVPRLSISSTGDCPLSSILACCKQIYTDLNQAITYYQTSGTARKENENHKINVNAAYATYARAAPTREGWSTAARYAALARASYPLMNADEYFDGFSTVNREQIWSIYNSGEKSLGSLSLVAHLAYNSSSTLVCTYPACINRELYDALPGSDIHRGLSLDPLEYAYSTGGITNSGLGGSVLTSYVQGVYPDLNTSAKMHAYISFKSKCIDKVGAMPLDLFHSSGIYFIKAEANCHLTPSKRAEARQLLKELIHDSGRDPQYTCDKSGQALLDEIKSYRRIELWNEGFSWFDFKRRKDTIVRHTFEDEGSYMTNAAVAISPEDTNNWM